MHFSTFSTGVAISVVSLLARSDAFWRMECRASSGLARIDPLVNYGQIGDHVHSIFGSNGTLHNNSVGYGSTGLSLCSRTASLRLVAS